ncbi:MAG: hypothetical protein QM790_15470 [Nibricoccus sp.]
MLEKKTCSIPERRTEMSDPRDIARRVLFILAAVGAPVGLILLGLGVVRHSLILGLVGGSLILDGAVLWILHNRWGAKTTADELKANPFKPGCRPKE